MPFLTSRTITETFLERVKATPDLVGFVYRVTEQNGLAGLPGKNQNNGNDKSSPKKWREVTFAEFYRECRQVAFGLMSLGIAPKDRVCILSETRYEWSLCDMAILGSGAITVPIYASNSIEDVAYILNHSGAKAVFAEDLKQLAKIVALKKEGKLPELQKIITIEGDAVGRVGREGFISQDLLTLQALGELGRRQEKIHAEKPDQAESAQRFDGFLKDAKPEDLFTICYTSGTTGTPKGAMLTHDNMMSVLEDCVMSLSGFVDPEKETILSFLPYSHVLGKVESMAVYVFGWRHTFAESIERLVPNLMEIQPTILFAVPRIFEKVYTKIQASIQSGSKAKLSLFRWGMGVGRRYYGAIWSKTVPSVGDAAQYAIAKRVVFSQIRDRLGGRLKFAICGGAPLAREIGEFFQVADITILEGYGLTETCAPVAVNRPSDVRFGTVGRPLPEVTIKIASDDGEILVHSRKVFKGYYRQPEETAAVLTPGANPGENTWFHTGDIGHIDAEGFLHITGRKKDLIVTSNGKKIAPQKIENIAKRFPLLTQMIAFGDRRNYLTALITVDREQVLAYAAQHTILFSDFKELIKHPAIMKMVQANVDEINRELAVFEAIKKFTILPNDFSIESGELTPSLKVKRGVVADRYRLLIDAMYG